MSFLPVGWVGHTTQTTCAIGVRAPAATVGNITVTISGIGTFTGDAISADTDWTSVVNITGLSANTRYTWQAYYNGNVIDGVAGSFRTDPEYAQNLSIVQISCLAYWHEYRFGSIIHNIDPSLVLFAGDLGYVDDPDDGSTKTINGETLTGLSFVEATDAARISAIHAHLRACLRQISETALNYPSVRQFGDHDCFPGNNWWIGNLTTANNYATLVANTAEMLTLQNLCVNAAMNSYWRTNPDNDSALAHALWPKAYFTVAKGACRVFVLDSYTTRSIWTDPGEKYVIDPTQEEWLLDGLAECAEPLKLISFGDGAPGFPNAPEQKARVLNAIDAAVGYTNAGGVACIHPDIHAMHVRHYAKTRGESVDMVFCNGSPLGIGTNTVYLPYADSGIYYSQPLYSGGAWVIDNSNSAKKIGLTCVDVIGDEYMEFSLVDQRGWKTFSGLRVYSGEKPPRRARYKMSR